jgi:DNA modification methylase
MKDRKKRAEEMNKLYFGDDLQILRDKIPPNSVDLIYLAPCFKLGEN